MTNDGSDSYIARPASGTGPGVLVLHAWWGLNDFFKAFCRRLSQEGFIALAPDLYHGQIAATVEDAERLHGQLDENKAAAEASAGHIIQVPLTLRDQIIGQITLETSSPALSSDQMDFVEAITTQTVLALENARLLNESERKASQEETLNRMSLQFSKALNIDDILRSAVRELGGLPAVTEVSVHMMSEDQFAASNTPVSGRKAEVLS